MLPLPGVPVEPLSPTLMLFSAIPWTLSAGLLGPIPSAILALITGSAFAIFETHSLFTPFELAGLGFCYSLLIQQRYRSLGFRLLRHPLLAAVSLSIIYIPVYMFGALFAVNGSLANRLDYAFTQIWLFVLARGLAIIFASIVAEAIAILAPKIWGKQTPLIPSPLETNLQTRFFYFTAPMVVALFLTLTVGDWLVAGSAARGMLQKRMETSAKLAADGLPFFLETGQNLVMNFATPDLIRSTPEQSGRLIMEKIDTLPYFTLLVVLDAQGKIYASYPPVSESQLFLTKEELTGINLAPKGIPVQVYTVLPATGEQSANLSFISVIRNENGQMIGSLLGRTALHLNPYTQPAISALASVNGLGMVIDDQGNVLYHTNPSLLSTKYMGKRSQSPAFLEEISSTGTRQLVFYQPVMGKNWAVILSVAAEEAQQLTLEIAAPMLVILLIFSLAFFLLLRVALRVVTVSLMNLSQEATLLSQGQLDHPVMVRGVDEVGQLGKSFEQMRVSLRARMEDLNRLLKVSQGVAANLEIADAVHPILMAALSDDAGAARVALVSEVTLDSTRDQLVAFGTGAKADAYAFLDQQLFEIVRNQDILSIPYLAKTRRLQVPKTESQPVALIALSIKHESRYYGVLWVAYEQAHQFTDGEVRFLSTLAGEAALAAANARLYATAEAGRQRLEAILNSTSEPVMVFDEQNRLLLINPAAMQTPGLISTSIPGAALRDVVESPQLVEFLTCSQVEPVVVRELSLLDGKTFYASISPVKVGSDSIGKVCILRDITQFKELDALKSEFVSTVSHDLRSPLTMMRGYATMLQMMGDLNEQQKGYVRRIIMGVENMTRLVNNLLDLGRIEAGIGLQSQNVSLTEVIDSVVNALQMQAAQKNLSMDLSGVSPGPIVIDADHELVYQALYNLLDNAIKYTPNGGQISVRCQPEREKVLIQVQDTGIGIAPLDLPRLFEKFYRSGRKEAYQQRGVGLGLAIVKSIVERHGGRIWVDSQLGKGSTFSVELPYKLQKDK
ncbi:MAG TPA: ATP-binding protein [Anaerolineaceae bacterium]